MLLVTGHVADAHGHEDLLRNPDGSENVNLEQSVNIEETLNVESTNGGTSRHKDSHAGKEKECLSQVVGFFQLCILVIFS